MEDSFRATLVENDTYKMEIELLSGCPFIHCQPYTNTVSMFKDIKHSANQLCYELSKRNYPTLFAAFKLTEKKHIKWAKHFGMKEEKRMDGWVLLGLNTDMEAI